MPDWSAEHRRQLLTRAVFDPATFGRIRLHNDNQGVVRGYLAARWLYRRRQANCPIPTLLDLLFADTYGVSVIKPSVQETAAWLAIRDPDVAREVVARAPEVLLSEGDPGSLSLAVRQAALTEVVRRIDLSKKRPNFDQDGLRRFSTADMASQILELWAAHKRQPEVRQLLLMMVWLGSLSACTDIAKEGAFGAFQDRATLLFGGRALLASSDSATLAQYATKIKATPRSLPGPAIWAAIEQLFMREIAIDEFLTLLNDMTEQSRDDHSGLGDCGPRLISRLSSREEIERLLTGLLTQLGPSTGNYAHPETRREKSYYPMMAAAAHALMQRVSDDEAPTTAIDAAFRLGEGRRVRSSYDNSLQTVDVQADLHKTAARRRLAFWWAAHRFKGHKLLYGTERPILSPHHMEMVGWSPGLRLEDCDWLLRRRAKTAIR